MCATINRKLDIDFLLDTGAELTVLPASYANSNILPLTDRVQRCYGVGGQAVTLRQTQPVTISVGPTEITSNLWVGEACQALLGMDVLLKLNSSLNFSEGKVVWNLRRLQKKDIAQHPIWAEGKNDCGLLDMEPVLLTGTHPPSTRQYPLSKDAIDGIRPIIKELEERNVLVKDIIPRWGLPDLIDSDQGTHFTGTVCAEVSRMMGVKWSLHCPHHPQSSGIVERTNRTLKERLAKMHQQGTPWPDALPAVLCSLRATHNKETGLSPFEVITGRPMSLPGTIDLRKADVHLTSDALISYCTQLTEAVKTAAQQVSDAWVEPPEGGHSIVPGQWVMVHKPQRVTLESKWDGPFQVLLITDAAVKLQGKNRWIHASFCKLTEPPSDAT